MKNYEKPMVMVNEGLAEGVYAASGAGCWSVSVSDGQVHSATDKRFQVSCDHIPENHVVIGENGQEYVTVTVVLTFNTTVDVVECSMGTYSGSGTNQMIITNSFSNPNPTENWSPSIRVSTTTGVEISTPSASISYTRQ